MILRTPEHVFLLSLYSPRVVLGVQNPYADALSAVAEKAMAEAMQSLQARGLIEVLPEGKVLIEPRLAGLVATCAFPDVSLVATYTDARGIQDVRFIHLTTQLIAEDMALPSGEHRLTRVSPGAVAERVVEQFHLADQQAAPGGRCVVARGVLETAREIARASGASATAQRLQVAGVDIETAAILAEALVKPISNSALALAQVNEPQAGRSLGILEASHGLWLLRFVDGTRVEVAPCDGAEAAHEVAELVAAAEAMLR